MGRFFLLILALQTFDKTNQFIQEIFFQDLNVPFYEIKFHVRPRSPITKLCIYFGAIRIFFDFLSQFYCLWLAVLIKQILKDPIHRLNRYIWIYNAITIIVSLGLTGVISIFNQFGVEVSILHSLFLENKCVFRKHYNAA